MRLLRLSLLSAALGAVCALAGAAPDEEVYIYRGGPVAQEGITAGGWGGGKAAESKEKILTGGQSIKIITQGLYAGARLDFAQPTALFTNGIDKTRYVVFTFLFQEVVFAQGTALTEPAKSAPAREARQIDLRGFSIPRDIGTTKEISPGEVVKFE